MTKLPRILLLTICLLINLSVSANPDRPLSVLIIGGGPAGLATAIEAHSAGAQVTIVEKRSEYTRYQRVFLLPPSLGLLQKWNAVIPHLALFDAGEFGTIGFVKIKDLEEGLENHVRSLGIEKRYGTFTGFYEGQAVIESIGGVELVDYDILVGADGIHSTTRNALGIDCDYFGSAVGSWAYMDFPDDSGPLDVSLFMIQADHFLRRISMPQGSIIFWQSYFNLESPFEELSQEQLVAEARNCGWEKEAQLIEKGFAYRTGHIAISLQQAKSFSDISQRAILVGDSAGCGSFFHGNGANTALKAAEIAGDFFKALKQGQGEAYDAFDKSMKQITDQLIDYSRPLLDPEVARSFTG